MQRIDLLHRFYAALIDYFFQALLLVVLAFVQWNSFVLVRDAFFESPYRLFTNPSVEAYQAILIFVAVYLIYGLTEVLFAATPGKLMRRYTIRAEDGSAAGWFHLLKRYVAKKFLVICWIVAMATGIQLILLIGEIGCFFLGAGLFLALLPDRQAVHDEIAGTAVYPLAPSEALPEAQSKLAGYLGIERAFVTVFIVGRSA